MLLKCSMIPEKLLMNFVLLMTSEFKFGALCRLMMCTLSRWFLTGLMLMISWTALRQFTLSLMTVIFMVPLVVLRLRKVLVFLAACRVVSALLVCCVQMWQLIVLGRIVSVVLLSRLL